MTTKRLLKYSIVSVSPAMVLLILSFVASGCMGSDTQKHVSDNNRAVAIERIESSERRAESRNDAMVASAQARADAKMHESTESTNRVIISQQGNLALLTAQSQHMLTLRQMGTDRFYAFLVFLAVIMLAGGSAWLYIYLRNNPRPVAHQMLTEAPQFNALPAGRGSLPQKQETSAETALAVPYSTFVTDPRFAAYGWEVQDNETGVQVDGQGRIINKCKLLEG